MSPATHPLDGPSAAAASPHPPRARLVLRIGVTGHRPGKDRPDKFPADVGPLRRQVHTVLDSIERIARAIHKEHAALFAPGDPILRLISPLAEGADRIVAEEALALHWELQCPLPFFKEEYEKDFDTEESKKQFNDLLQKATTTSANGERQAHVLELDGTRARVEDAYLAVGQMVLKQCDVLIAIWDGNVRADNRVGTTAIVREAVNNDISVIWIKSQSPHEESLMRRPDELSDTEEGWFQREEFALLCRRLQQLLLPPEPASGGKSDLREAYFREKQRHLTLGFVWLFFRDWFNGTFRRQPLLAENFQATTEKEWAKEPEGIRPELKVSKEKATAWEQEWRQAPKLDDHVNHYLDDSLRSHYAWADKLADFYANNYRSSFLLNYLFSVLAVLLAVLAHVLSDYQLETQGLIKGEMVVLVCMFLLYYWSRRRRLHDRWIDYRLLAELLRVQRFLAPLGSTLPPFARPGAHQTYGDPRISWVYWHFRAIVRQAGMVTACFTADYLRAYRCFLWKKLILDQWEYHYVNVHKRFHRLSRHLEATVFILFGLVFVASLIHWILDQYEISDPYRITIFIAAVFPALGAAFHSISVQSELERLVRRSETMSELFKQAAYRLGDLQPLFSQPSPPSIARALGRIVDPIARDMISENTDWRLVFTVREWIPG